MKIKGVIEDLEILKKLHKVRKKKKRKKNDHKNSKNISRTFSAAVLDSVGSVHFQIVLGPAYISQDL